MRCARAQGGSSRVHLLGSVSQTKAWRTKQGRPCPRTGGDAHLDRKSRPVNGPSRMHVVASASRARGNFVPATQDEAPRILNTFPVSQPRKPAAQTPPRPRIAPPPFVCHWLHFSRFFPRRAFNRGGQGWKKGGVGPVWTPPARCGTPPPWHTRHARVQTLAIEFARDSKVQMSGISAGMSSLGGPHPGRVVTDRCPFPSFFSWVR